MNTATKNELRVQTALAELKRLKERRPQKLVLGALIRTPFVAIPLAFIPRIDLPGAILLGAAIAAWWMTLKQQADREDIVLARQEYADAMDEKRREDDLEEARSKIGSRADSEKTPIFPILNPSAPRSFAWRGESSAQ